MLTTADPPPNGIERSVNATIDTSGAVPVLIEAGGFSPGDIPWYLYASLGGLVIIAVVLVALIVRKPSTSSSKPAESRTSGPPIQPTLPSNIQRVETTSLASTQSAQAGKVCAKCQKVNTPDAQWCEECGEPLQVAKTEVPRASSSTSLDVVVRRNAETKAIVEEVPEEPPMADLTIIEGEGAKSGTTFSLRKCEQTIGRSDTMAIILSDDTVSRKHASIFWEEGAFYLKDEGSTSGTFVNSQKVTKIQAHRLTNGDRIQLGKTKLMFRTIQGVPDPQVQ